MQTASVLSVWKRGTQSEETYAGSQMGLKVTHISKNLKNK